jgi:bifunctional ADP-heptose synthase (sugar kinase/adenylyltransferase)
MFHGANWLTPNKHEFRKILDFIHIRQPMWEQVPEMVCEYAELDGILLTRGSEGMDLFATKITPHGKTRRVRLHEDSVNTDIIDVTGAGDTALATFAAVKTLGCKDHEIALKLANEIAGEVCMSRGTTVPAKTLKERGFDYGHTEKKEE